MIRRGGILSDAQVAMELESKASRGVRVGQDTTACRGTEHVSTVWGVRKMALCATYSLSPVVAKSHCRCADRANTAANA